MNFVLLTGGEPRRSQEARTALLYDSAGHTLRSLGEEWLQRGGALNVSHRLLLGSLGRALPLFCPMTTLHFFSVVKMGIRIFNTLFFSPWQIQIEKCRRANKTF